jgi:uncharacterized protein YigA (DUF484 family)
MDRGSEERPNEHVVHDCTRHRAQAEERNLTSLMQDSAIRQSRRSSWTSHMLAVESDDDVVRAVVRTRLKTTATLVLSSA